MYITIDWGICKSINRRKKSYKLFGKRNFTIKIARGEISSSNKEATDCSEDCVARSGATLQQATATFPTSTLSLAYGFISSPTSSLVSCYTSQPNMALLLPFPSHNPSLSYSLSTTTHKLPTPRVYLSLPLRQPQLRKSYGKCGAVADIRAVPPLDAKEEEEEGGDQKVFVGPASEEERRGDRIVADYDWTEEWYPLYLTQDVPDDAPLGLTVFDKQIVLYRDGNGQLRCYQDRCAHR